MTQLQHLAFERIEKLSKETLNLLPKQIKEGTYSIDLSIFTIERMKDNLYEQQDLITALLEEDRKEISDGFDV